MIATANEYDNLFFMNDQSTASISLPIFAISSALAVVFASPAYAGEQVIYASAPEWVEQAPLSQIDTKDAPSSLIYDWQHRLEDGVVTSYEDTAIRIDNPELLTNNGTISLTWMPDKGDLTVHKVRIIRGDEMIDVIGSGAAFDVIRREQGLEQRLLNGQLTATLAVPGLQVGDILRVSHSVTVDDQAMGDGMQVMQYLPSEPWQVGFSRTIVSWPEDADIYWRAEEIAKIAPPITEGGYRRLTVDLPIEEPPEMPGDAPSRFTRAPILRVGTYTDWQELSQSFAPHYISAAQVADDSAVAGLARKIMDETKDPLERAALAVQLVQDEISYLLNGLDGGNYMPQSAAETWEKRYGDCKAKSVLLYSLLTRMGIEVVPVLVATGGGDALPELLPIPGNFDHMIVRARIDGQDYWLDGTSAATRITNIGAVPPFFYALPLTTKGTDLVPMTQRAQPWPDMAMEVTSDYSAGVDFPALFSAKTKIYGPQGAQIRAMADEADEDKLKRLASSIGQSSNIDLVVTSVDVAYDEEAAVGTMSVEGVAPSSFTWEEGRMRLGSKENSNFHFNPDRARSEWRDIPVQTTGPRFVRTKAMVILPDGLDGFVNTMPEQIDMGFANTSLSASSKMEGGQIINIVEAKYGLGEIPASEIAKHKRSVRKIDSMSFEVIAPEDFAWRWELSPDELAKRAAPIFAAYDAGVDFAADDDWEPLRQRAAFRSRIFDWKGALSDLDRLIEEEPGAYLYSWRAGVHEALGNYEAAIEDSRTAYNLEPSSNYGLALAERMAYNGLQDEALDLLEMVSVGEDEQGDYASVYATVAGLAGRTEDALSVLESEIADKPSNASVLNADCWFRGLFNIDPTGAMPSCTKAVERADGSAAMLDSRAMVSYRLGDYDAALKDLNSALELVPGLSASLYLRGIVRLEQGDNGGRADVEQALRISPELAARYAEHGINPEK